MHEARNRFTFYHKMHCFLSQIDTRRSNAEIPSTITRPHVFNHKGAVLEHFVFFCVQWSSTLVMLEPGNFRLWAACGGAVKPNRLANESGLIFRRLHES